MTLLSNQTVCRLISKGYFAQAMDRINNPKLDLDTVEEDGRTTLILCAFIDDTRWSLSLARFTLQLDVNISRKDYLYQMNVLHYCCIFERAELLELLLESVDFDINCGDCYGNSPLIYAITVNNLTIIELMIKFYKRYKIDVDKTNLKGINALMQACLNGNLELIGQLLDMGANVGVKDSEGKSATQYKEEAISKSDIITHFKENRRQSRMVRFDDIELIIKLEKETIELRQNTFKIPEVNNPNFERVKDVQMRSKRLKRNKIDYAYVSKSIKSVAEHNRNVERRNESMLRKIRPKTAFQTSQMTQNKDDWYSIIGPLYVSLEQQCAPSFRLASKYEDATQTHEAIAEKYRSRGRRSSRTFGTLSRKNSISGRLVPSDDGVSMDFTAAKFKKKNENIATAKSLLRNISRFGIKSSNSSVINP